MKKAPGLTGGTREKRPPSVTRAALEGAALRYLERFDCTTSKLKQILDGRVSKAARAGDEAAQEAPEIITQLLERYQSSGLINDRRFAEHFTARQRDRGASRRRIEQKLRQRGVPPELSAAALSSSNPRESELEAARALARRRRLGPHRKPETRAEFRQKDLMTLARAGFDYDIATRVVGNSSSEEDC